MPSSTYLALLRGINVSGKHILPMQDLRALFVDLGCSNVRTYIQSGNVLFDLPAGRLEGLASQVETKILERFGFPAPVTLRSRKQIDEIAAANPFLPQVTDFAKLVVLFLQRPPGPVLLDSSPFAPDEFYRKGQEVFIYYPNGIGRSKLTNAYFDKALSTVTTGRNWNTFLKLRELLSS